jgi:prepilin signal peptidase PulO-like enzyme (type II secretory pathway)
MTTGESLPKHLHCPLLSLAVLFPAMKPSFLVEYYGRLSEIMSHALVSVRHNVTLNWSPGTYRGRVLVLVSLGLVGGFQSLELHFYSMSTAKARTAHAKAILGSELHSRLANTSVLLVGAGGIGCELRAF